MHSDHEISIGGNVNGELNLIIARFSGGVSPSYRHNWGSSTSNSKTETTTYQRTVTVPSQQIIVNPFSKVEVFTDFFSYEETIHYLIDLEIDEMIYVNYTQPLQCGGKTFDQDTPNFMALNLQYHLNYISRSSGSQDEVNIVKMGGQFILKNIPFVAKMTGYHSEIRVGKQMPLD